MSLFGLILAGGKSSRMGFDKAQLNFHGVNQLRWLHNVLAQFCPKIFVSGSPKKITGNYNFIEDIYDRGGPMNGILSAFKKYPDTDWLVVPVDMPNVNFAIELLVKERDIRKQATCFVGHNKMIEPIPVILEHSSYLELLDRFLRSEESLFNFLNEANVNLIAPLNPSWLVNKNYPDLK